MIQLGNIIQHPSAAMATGRIRILRGPHDRDRDLPMPAGRVFVTLGAAETHVTILDDEGRCRASWIAVFGWSFLLGLPIERDGVSIRLDDPDAVIMALSGKMRIYGRSTDTRGWIARAESEMIRALDDILDQTIGSGICQDGIVLAGPEWLHDLLGRMRSIRPHVDHEIRET